MDLQKGFLLSVLLVLVYIAGLMFQPFLPYLLATVIIAVVLYPAHRRLRPYIGERISAGFLILFLIVAAILPLGLAVNAVVDDARNLASSLDESELIRTDDIEQMIERWTGQQVDVDAQLQRIANDFVSNTLGGLSAVLNFLTNVSIGLSLSFFVLFYLLKDGERFKKWTIDTTPMPEDIQERLYDKTYQTTWAVMKGHVLVALTQGLIAGAGLFIVGVESYAFWTFMMIVLAFIPIVGAFLVWGPAGGYLLLSGRPYAGLFLLVWGAVVVGLTDNFLRPLLVDRGADLHPAVILIGVIGGLYVFNAAGIFMGPIALGVLKSVLEVFRDNYDDL